MSGRDGLERALGDALRVDEAAADDDALLGRVIDGALTATPSPPLLRVPRSLRLGLVVGGAALLGAGAWLATRRDPIAPPIVETHAVETQPSAIPSATGSPEVASAAPPVNAAPTTTPIAPPKTTPTLSAIDRFARANDERRKGKDEQAIDDYRALQRDDPKSPEAMASHVALGRLLLDRHADANGALAQFDQYLAGASEGTLQEEALIGRALAYQRLGRDVEEQRAWKTVLEKYPESVYADQARARLDALKR